MQNSVGFFSPFFQIQNGLCHLDSWTLYRDLFGPHLVGFTLQVLLFLPPWASVGKLLLLCWCFPINSGGFMEITYMDLQGKSQDLRGRHGCWITALPAHRRNRKRRRECSSCQWVGAMELVSQGLDFCFSATCWVI